MLKNIQCSLSPRLPFVPIVLVAILSNQYHFQTSVFKITSPKKYDIIFICPYNINFEHSEILPGLNKAIASPEGLLERHGTFSPVPKDVNIKQQDPKQARLGNGWPDGLSKVKIRRKYQTAKET